MDDRHPKRRKDKYNPYTLSLVDGKCYLSFKDGQGFPHKLELDVKLYALFDRFELDDIYYADLTPVVGCEQGARCWSYKTMWATITVPRSSSLPLPAEEEENGGCPPISGCPGCPQG